MGERPLTVASAVIVPEPSNHHKPSPTRAKRAGLPLVSESEKRVCLDNISSETAAASSTTHSDQVDIKSSRATEERKRGKRLYGALLGTLSQSSSSAAERRRADIEKKQREKLKSRSDQHDETRKQRYDALQEVRLQEQRKYEHQSLLINQSNQLSMAGFLITSTKPQLYYIPWELRPEENEKIALQFKDVEDHVVREGSRNNLNGVLDKDGEASDVSERAILADNLSNGTVGDVANSIVTPDHCPLTSTDPGAHAVPNIVKSPSSTGNHEREQADDAGEVVEGDEDTVIY